MLVKCASLFIASLCILLEACDHSQPETSATFYTLTIGDHTAQVEVAHSDQKRTQGLMYRYSLGTNAGMLFVYPSSSKLSFWMKNTHIPLSIAFIATDGRITDILDMEVYDGRPDYLLPHYTSSEAVQYALEMQKGWFQQKQIQAGYYVKFGSELQQLLQKIGAIKEP